MSTPPGPDPHRPSPSGRGGDLGASSTGLVKALFDFNFDTFITPKIVKIVYMVATVLVAVATLGMIFSALAMMTDGGVAVLLGLIFLVAAPVLGLIYLAFIRMSLELYYAVIRLSEDVHHGPGRL